MGILRTSGPSGQGTEGYPKTAATKEGQCGSAPDFVTWEKEVATVRKWGYPVSKDERDANF